MPHSSYNTIAPICNQKPPTSSSAVQVDSFTSATAEAVDGSMAHKTCTVPGNIS